MTGKSLKLMTQIDTRCLDFSSKCTKMRLVAGLRPDPLVELTTLPRTHTWIQVALLLRGKERRMRAILYPDLGDKNPCYIMNVGRDPKVIYQIVLFGDRSKKLRHKLQPDLLSCIGREGDHEGHGIQFRMKICAKNM